MAVCVCSVVTALTIYSRQTTINMFKTKLNVFSLLEPYASMPPLELFMEVSFEERRAMLYRDLDRGDAIVGRINNIREYGFFLTLLCCAGGLERDIEDLELSVGESDLFTDLCALEK